MKRTKQIIALLSFASILFLGCKKTLIDKMTEDVFFTMNANSFLKNQVQLQFINARYKESKTIPKIVLTVIDDTKDLVYDINGSRNIVVDNQFAILAVSPGKTIPSSEPVRFYIRAEAPGFLPVQKEIIVRDEDDFQSLTFEMPEINMLPEGIKMNTQGEMEVVQFDVTKDPVAYNTPYLISKNTQKISVNGRVQEIAFFPVQYATVRNTNGSNEEGNISLELPSGARDAVTNELYQVGETVQIFRKDVQSDTWNYEADVVLTRGSNGNPKALINNIRPGEIAMAKGGGGGTTTTCPANFAIRFSRPTDVSTLHYVEVVNQATNRILTSANSVNVSNTLVYPFTTRLPTNTDITVRVYEFETRPLSARVVASLNIPRAQVCGSVLATPATISVNPPSVTNNPVFSFDLDTYCYTSGATGTAYYHDGRTQFRRANTADPFIDLGKASRVGISTATSTVQISNGAPTTTGLPYSSLSTDRLPASWNQYYEFQTTITGINRRTRKATTKTYRRLRKLALSQYQVLVSPTVNDPVYKGGQYKYFRDYWFAPSTACADFGY